MEDKAEIKYEFYIKNSKDNYTEVAIDDIDNYYYPVKIVIKAGLKTLTEWEIKRPNDELLIKNNIVPNSHPFKSVLPLIIEEIYKPYESYIVKKKKTY